MKTKFKPDGYNSVSPYFMIDDPAKFADMLTQVFGAKPKRQYTRPDGSLMHAEMQIDDSIIMFSQATEQYPAYTFWMHIYVPDVDHIFDKAVEFGCEVVEKPVEKQGDSDRRGSFQDFAGNFWAVGTQVREESYPGS